MAVPGPALPATPPAGATLAVFARLEATSASAGSQVSCETRTDRTSPTRVPGGRTWTILTTGDAATCGVDAAGSGWCWGSNRYGQLGDGGDRDGVGATEVVADGPGAAVDAGWFHSCGRFRDGATACWGNNELGQVEDGTRTDGPQPKEVG